MDEHKTPDPAPGDQRDSFVSRNSATIIGLGAILLMVLATVYTMLKK